MINVLEEKIKHVPLTKTQKRIAEYFLRNQERIGNLASLEVAKEIGVSDASIIRFSRKIGYDGYAALKKDIYDSLADKVMDGIGQLRPTERFSITKRRFPKENIRGSFLDLMEHNLKQTLLANQQEDFEAAVQMIHRARKRLVIGFHACKGTALQFSRLLAIVEPDVSLLLASDPEDYVHLQNLAEDDVVIVFSFARHYEADVNFIRYVKQRRAKIVLITDSVLAPYAKHADISFVAATNHMSFFNSQVGAICIAEYLITLLTKSYDCIGRLDERDSLMEHLLMKD